MIKTMVLIPVRDNHGKPSPPAAWRELGARLLQFGGLTVVRNVTGARESRGRIYRDRSRRYEVGLDSWFQLAAWLGIVRWAREVFKQGAIYFEVAGIPEVFRGA